MQRTLFIFSFFILCVIACFTHSIAVAQTELSSPDLPRYPAATPKVLPSTQAPAYQQPNQSSALGAPLAQVANAPARVDPQAVPMVPRMPVGPPFQISPVEQQFVDQILQMWENESSKIETYSSSFQLWEYDPVWLPLKDTPITKNIGRLTYSKPDKGSFKIEEVRRWTKQDPNQQGHLPGDWVLQKKEVGKHWVCDGKAVYQYRHDIKQLVVQPLPPELQGKAIVDGPLPFLFGAKADELKRRYWIRSKQSDPEMIWLEAYPRKQEDAANYHHVEVMLNRKTMQPRAIQVHKPNNNQSRDVYMFDEDPTINGKLNALLGGLFSAPRTPLGWKKVVQELPTGQPASPQAANPQPTVQR